MSLSSVSFANESGKTLQVAINAPVPGGYKPFDQNNGYTYTYYDVATKSTITLPPAVPSPGTWILKAVIVAKVPDLSKGEAYSTPNGDQIIIPSGATVPLDWKPISSVDIGSVVLVDNGDGIVVAPAPPENIPQPATGNLWKIVGGVIGAAGAIGLGYLGYLAWSSPHQLAKVVETSAKTAGIAISLAQSLVAVAVIGALSFVGYEFLKSMDANNGNIAKAISSMIAGTIEVFVNAVVDTVEQLVKDAWTFMVTEIKSILPSWL